MPTLEEVSCWSIQELQTHVHAHLPVGWKFDLQPRPDFWLASYRSETGAEVWVDTHWNLQYILLAAYCWMWLRREPPTGHPAWRVLPPRVLVPIRPGSSTNDPEDLDPNHLRSVYAKLRNR